MKSHNWSLSNDEQTNDNTKGQKMTRLHSIYLRSYVDRDGNSRFYWVDEVRNEVSRWSWESEADAREAMQDGIDWEKR